MIKKEVRLSHLFFDHHKLFHCFCYNKATGYDNFNVEDCKDTSQDQSTTDD